MRYGVSPTGRDRAKVTLYSSPSVAGCTRGSKNSGGGGEVRTQDGRVKGVVGAVGAVGHEKAFCVGSPGGDPRTSCYGMVGGDMQNILVVSSKLSASSS